jgi:hypothetical protein
MATDFEAEALALSPHAMGVDGLRKKLQDQFAGVRSPRGAELAGARR